MSSAEGKDRGLRVVRRGTDLTRKRVLSAGLHDTQVFDIFGGARRNRTDDLFNAIEAFEQFQAVSWCLSLRQITLCKQTFLRYMEPQIIS